MADGAIHASVRLRYALGTFVAVALIGTVGYELIEGWSFVESLYMTLITITTVGFSEVHQLSSAGRIYTMFLLMGGVGAAAYTAFTAVELLVDREMRWVLKGRRMENRVKRLRNHVILCGHGRVGRFIADEFRRRFGLMVVGIKREGTDTVFNPESTEALRAGDILILIGPADKLEACAARAAGESARHGPHIRGPRRDPALVSPRAVS